MNFKSAIIGLLLVSLLALSITKAAGFGETGTGPEYFNVSLNHSVSSHGWVLVNNDTHNMSFFIDVPQLTANEPKITVSALNGTIPRKDADSSPYISYPVLVTVYMPLNAPLYKTWTLYVTAYGVVNNTGGTTTDIGTAKRLTIFSEPSTTSTTTTTSISTTIAVNSSYQQVPNTKLRSIPEPLFAVLITLSAFAGVWGAWASFMRGKKNEKNPPDRNGPNVTPN